MKYTVFLPELHPVSLIYMFGVDTVYFERLQGGVRAEYAVISSPGVMLRTSCKVFLASSDSWKIAVLPLTWKHRFLIELGVGEEASGYSLGSLSVRCRGGLINKGGKEVVVVVVVVTTVVWVVGA